MDYNVSIIIPIFNVEFYIERCLQSLINQSIGFENLEVILIDDVSTDNTRYIIEKYAEKYDNIRYCFLKENSGAAGKPRNTGLEMASADYVMFLDPDDFLAHDACEVLYDKITSENVDIVSGIYAIKDKEDNYIPYPNLWATTITDPCISREEKNRIVKELLEKNNYEIRLDSYKDMNSIIRNFGGISKIYSLKLIREKNLSFPVNIPAQDSVFLYEFFLNASGILFIDNIIYYYDNNRYEKGNESMTYQVNVKRNSDRLSAYKLMLDISRKHDNVENFAYYLLSGKLEFYLDRFIVYTNLSRDEIKQSLDGYYELFDLVYESDYKILDKFVAIFEKIHERDIDGAIDYIFTIRK